MVQEQQGIKVYDIYEWWYRPFWYHPAVRTFIWVATILSVILLLWAFVRYVKRSQKKPLDPWQEALNNLKQINLTLFEEPETHKLFYSHLTRVLKTYLGRRYDLSLDGKTDQEVIRALEQSTLPADLQEHVRGLFSGAETIKFAHQEGAGERMRYDLIRAIDIIRNTIPNPKNRADSGYCAVGKK